MTRTLRQLLVSVLAALTLAAGCSRSDPPPAEIEEPAVVSATTLAPAVKNPQLPTEPVENQVETEEIVEVEPPGDGEAPQITVRTRSASLDYLPGADGFSFANFGGGEAPADLTVNMARRLYGDTQVCAEVVDNQCTPYPVILQLISQANRSMRGGLCEGLTVLSLRLAADPTVLAAYQGARTVAELVKEDPALLSELAYWYVTQFATEVQEQASAFLELAPITLAQVLLKDFTDAEAGKGATGYTVGIYSEQGGHAVTPYRVEQIEDQYRIYIYDSNWPNAERWIDVDENGWTYALAATNPTEEAEAWGGGVGTMELTPMTARSGPFSCGFCPVDDESGAGTMLTVAGSGSKQMAIKIETDAGQRLGYYDGAFVNEIPGATYRYLISGTATADPVLVFLPPGVDDFSADVEVVDVPVPVGTDVASDPQPGQAFVEQEEEETQQFSLLVLDEERSVQIDAAIELAPEEEELPASPVEEEPREEEPAREALLSFTEESVQVGDIEEAVVEIAVEAVAIEIELDQGQQIEVVFSETPAIPVETAPGDAPAAAPVVEMQTLSIEITAETGQSLAEVSIDVQDHVPEVAPTPDISPPGDESADLPGEELPVEPVAPASQPVQIEITYDEELGEVTQVEDEIEAWVASDAEYFRAVAEDRVEEVLGESYVEELEEREEWAPPVEDEDLGPLIAVIQDLADDYWEDEHWEEVNYDEEWFAEELAEEALFTGEVDEEWWLEEEELEVWLEEEVPFVDVTWIEEESEASEAWDEMLEAGAPGRAEIEEQHILDEMGLTEWDEDLMGPPPSETINWEEEDWEEFDEEWAASEEAQILADEGLDEWPEEWGPSPSESALWTEVDWQAFEAEQEALWEQEEPEQGDPVGESDLELDLPDAGEVDTTEDVPPGESEEWTAEDEEAWMLQEEGLEDWPEEWGPSPSESWGWTEEDWETYDAEQQASWETELLDEPGDDDVNEEEETAPQGSEEEPGDAEEEPDNEADVDASDTGGNESDQPGSDNAGGASPDGDNWTGIDEEEAILAEEELTDWPEDDGEAPGSTDEGSVCDDGWCEDEPPPPEPEDPHDGWGDPPPGYANWGDYEQETAAGITGGDELPTFVVVADYLPPPPPPQEVYIPTITYEHSDQAVSETISSETVTTQTGTATTTNVTTSESGILTQNVNDGHWHLDTTTVTTTETTVTDTLVDTTTVVARTGSDMMTCAFADGVGIGCDTVRGWSPATTTETASDAYTQASTTTAAASVTVMTEEGCSEGGWRGMGDWCMVSSGGRGDADLVQFSLGEATNVRIDAESNLTYAQFVAGNNEHGDPFIYLNQDNDSDEGDHSGDADAVTIGIQVESDDDGGRNCDDNGVGIQGCINPPSTATDPDETPTITYCASGAACSDGVPVIDNVSDTWDSEIVRTNLPEGDYVVRAAVYSEGHDGWYRLTIEEDD